MLVLTVKWVETLHLSCAAPLCLYRQKELLTWHLHLRVYKPKPFLQEIQRLAVTTNIFTRYRNQTLSQQLYLNTDGGEDSLKYHFRKLMSCRLKQS